MAFKDVNAYRKAAKERHGDLSDLFATDYNSTQRDEIAKELQWASDNKFGPSDPEAEANFKEWFNLMAGGSQSTENFELGNLSNSKFGGQEITSLGYMMMDMNTMLDEGCISRDEYDTYMNRLFSSETLDDLKQGGEKVFLNWAEDIDGFADREPDPALKEANMADAVYTHDEMRPVINSADDYKKSAAERRGSENTYTADTDAKEGMSAALLDAKENGLITEDQYNSMRSYMRNDMQPGYGVRTAYFVEDVLNTGDPDLIDSYISGDALSNLSADDYSRVDEMARLYEKLGNEPEPGVDYGGATMEITQEQMEGLDEMVKADGQRGYADFVMDNMTADYFAGEGADRKAPMSYEEYCRLNNEFNNIPPSAIGEFITSNPGFQEAHAVMTGISDVGDQIDEAVNNGTYMDGITIELNSYLAGAGDDTDWIADSIADAANGEHRIPGGTNAGTYGKDVDAEVSAVNLDLLKSGKCPTDRFEDLKEAAQTVWRGGVYGSGETRKERLAEAGFSPDEIHMIQSMVNKGDQFCQNVTTEQFDEMFKDEYGTLAEQDATYMESVNAMLSYEGGRDFMEAYNAQAGDGEQISAEEAANMYRAAALGGMAAEERGEELTEPDAAGNLADFIADGEKAFDENLRNAGRETEAPDATVEKEAEEPAIEVG